MTRKRILCTGRLHFEVLVQRLEYLPPRFSVFRPQDIKVIPAGAGFTTASILGNLGNDVSVVGQIGNDWQGNAFLEVVKACGLKAEIRRSATTSPTSVNLLAIDSSGNVRYLVSDGPDELFVEIPAEQLGNFDWLHIGNANLFAKGDEDTLSCWIRRFRSKNGNAVVSADTTKSPEFADAVKCVAEEVDYLFCNEIEAANAIRQSGVDARKSAAELLSYGVRKAVIVKRGEKGAYWLTSSGLAHDCPAFPIRRCAENHVAGSGDAYCAGAIHSLLNDASAGSVVENAAEFGNMTAAYQIEEYGGSLAVPPYGWTSSAIAEYGRSRRAEATQFDESVGTIQDTGELFDATRSISPLEMRTWMQVIRIDGRLDEFDCGVVVDVGCGTGRFAVPIAEKFNCTVIGIDNNQNYLNTARLKEPRRGHIKWIHCNIDDMHEELAKQYARKVDCIWISSVLEDVPIISHERLFAHISQLLRSEGLLFIRTTIPELLKRNKLFEFFPAALNEIEKRSPKIEQLIRDLFDSGFVLQSIRLMDSAEKIRTAEYISRLQKRPYQWAAAYDDPSNYNECLEKFRRFCEDTRLEYCYNHRPSYLLCARNVIT
jgi:sugar/nucleoside kinase (ribokinase family)/2-polyprenyl-3-methyl-5-hydroxy-6-metoxy-1,4-benzoquinol methylase